MTESTSEYKKRIEEIKQSIENEPYMAKMREDIAEGISKTGIRQATVEEQFQSVLDETTGKDVISAPEIILARNGEVDLKTRLDKEKQEVTAQLAQHTTNEAVHRKIYFSDTPPNPEDGVEGDVFIVRNAGLSITSFVEGDPAPGKVISWDGSKAIWAPIADGKVKLPPLPYFDGLQLHLELESGITTRDSDGVEYVTTWSDQSGNNRNLIQTDQTKQPTLTEKGVYGDGTSLLIREPSDDILRNVESATIISIVEWVEPPVNSFVFGCEVPVADNSASLALLRGYLGNYSTAGRRLGTDTVQFVTSEHNTTINKPTIYSSTFLWGESKLRQYVDGQLDGVNDNFQTSGNTEDVDGSLITMFNNPAMSRGANVYISDLLVYSPALTDAQRLEVETFLANKRGITL